MSDVRDPNEREDDEADDTLIGKGVERGSRRARRAPSQATAQEPPAFEQTFASDDSADPSDPPTSVWDGTSSEPTGPAAPWHEGDVEPADDEPTRTVLDSELAQVLPFKERRAASDPHAWYLGRSFGGFRIVRAIASGGMATVFLARKEGPARVSKHAAIKVVHPHLAYEREFVHMFLDEARIAALLDHPNVCHVLDFGMAEGTYYLAMEYVLGETWATVRNALADHAEGARILPAVTAHVLAQACEGLHAAHEAQDDSGRALCIVHRDVSPQNIFVAYDGTVRVLDFGIARAADRITSTRDGVLKGRLAYMSPEQMSIAEVGPAADIWSIGVVLREALEGKRLFRRATDAETMLAVTQEALPPWSEGVPEALRAIADKALAHDPAARHGSARELARELSQYAQRARSQVGSSELSVWMGLMFGAEIEQKRALLQLPMPAQRAGGAPPMPPPMEEAEPSEPSAPAATGPSTQPARPEARAISRPARGLNVAALIALATVGTIVGLSLGRVLHREPSPRLGEHARKLGQSARAPVPVVDQLQASDAPVVSQLKAGEAKPTVSQRARAPEATPAKAVPANTALDASSADAPRIKEGTQTEKREPQGSEAKAGTATLLVAFESGWAEISLGERRLGTTPGRFVVPAGKQTLTVRPFGTGKPFSKRVELAPDQVLKLFLSAPSP